MKRFAIHLGLLFLWCTLPLALDATTVVIYITPRFVILAADSKGVFTNVGTNQESSRLVSKIYQRESVYFSIAGVAANSGQSLDISRSVDAELKNFTNWGDVNARIKAAVIRALLPYLNYMKLKNRSLFLNNIRSSDYFTSIALVGLANNKPYAHLFGFKVNDADEITISTDEIDYGAGNTSDAVYYLGQKLAINKYMESVQRVDGPPRQFVEKLIRLQVRSTPKLVGEPIDILQITPGGTKWLKRKRGTPVVFP